MSPTLQADSVPAEPQGKPKNTGVGTLSLLQWIFPIQDLNRGLCCRRIFYQLSYQGSPYVYIRVIYYCNKLMFIRDLQWAKCYSKHFQHSVISTTHLMREMPVPKYKDEDVEAQEGIWVMHLVRVNKI